MSRPPENHTGSSVLPRFLRVSNGFQGKTSGEKLGKSGTKMEWLSGKGPKSIKEPETQGNQKAIHGHGSCGLLALFLPREIEGQTSTKEGPEILCGWFYVQTNRPESPSPTSDLLHFVTSVFRPLCCLFWIGRVVSFLLPVILFLLQSGVPNLDLSCELEFLVTNLLSVFWFQTMICLLVSQTRIFPFSPIPARSRRMPVVARHGRRDAAAPWHVEWCSPIRFLRIVQTTKDFARFLGYEWLGSKAKKKGLCFYFANIP